MSSLAKSCTLIVFDVDGTLLDANIVDNDCFGRAFQEETGVVLTAPLWEQFKEVTAQAIVHQALGNDWPDIESVKARVKDSFLSKLRESYDQDPALIRGFESASGLMSHLKASPDFVVAIATGCWRETAQFKLNAAGFDVLDVPFASASDCYGRAEIISLAVERAGGSLDRAVYVGDGVWDLRATQQLGIPFIGVGRKIEALRKAGAQYTLENLNEADLVEILKQIRN